MLDWHSCQICYPLEINLLLSLLPCLLKNSNPIKYRQMLLDVDLHEIVRNSRDHSAKNKFHYTYGGCRTINSKQSCHRIRPARIG